MKLLSFKIFFCALFIAFMGSSCSHQKQSQAKKPTTQLKTKPTPKHTPKNTHSTAPSPSKGASTSSIKKKYAEQLGVSPSSLKNDDLFKFIDGWMGVKYQFGGNSKSGIDCSGFVCTVYKEVYGKSIPRTTSSIGQASKSISKNQLEEGDIVIFDINGRQGSHVGIYLANGKFVHASTSKGVVISDLSNPYYQKAFSRGGKI